MDTGAAVASEEELRRLAASTGKRRRARRAMGPVQRLFARVHTHHYSTVKEVLVVLIVVHIFASSLLGTTLQGDVETVLIVFFSLYWIDIVTRILGMGVKDFWNVSRHPFESMVNRFGARRKWPHRGAPLVCVSCAPCWRVAAADMAIMTVATLVVIGDEVYRQVEGSDRGAVFRFGLALPVVRIFGAMKTSRGVIFGLASILPSAPAPRALAA